MPKYVHSTGLKLSSVSGQLFLLHGFKVKMQKSNVLKLSSVSGQLSIVFRLKMQKSTVLVKK